MRVLTSRVGDLSSYFDKINEKFFDNHTTQANKGGISAQLKLKHVFGFLERFQNKTKGLDFHLTFKTTGFQTAVYTTPPKATVISVKKTRLPLFVPLLKQFPRTQ